MALLFLDSFDHYATADIAQKWTQVVTQASFSNTPIISSSAGRRGTSGVRFPSGASGTAGISVTLAPSGATSVIGFAFTHSGAAFSTLNNNTDFDPTDGGSGSCQILHIYYLGVIHIVYRVTTSGTIQVLRGNGTSLGVTTQALSVGVTSYLEFKTTINGSTGTVDIHIDGISALSLTGLNTQNGGSAGWDQIIIGHRSGCGGGGNSIVWDYDDLYVADGSGSTWNDFKGDTRVDATFPNAAGNTSNFTRSTGSDQSATIDDPVMNGDTDYNSTTNVSDKDTLNFSTAPAGAATIYAIQVCCQGRKTDAGAAGHKAVTRISSTDYLGTEVALTSTYSVKRQIWETKPSDSTAWTSTDYGNAEFGYQKSS